MLASAAAFFIINIVLVKLTFVWKVDDIKCKGCHAK